MGGDDPHAAAGQQVDLHAGAAHLLADDHLLDHSPTGSEVVEEPRGQRGHGGQHLVRVARGAGVVAQVEDEVAVAGAAVVVLDDDGTHRGSRRADPLGGRGHVVDAVHVLAAQRHRHPAAVEQPAACALERLGPQRGRGAVDGQAQRERDGDLVLGDVPRLDEGRAVTHDAADLVEQVGAVEQLLGERARGLVVDGDAVHPVAHPVGDVGRHQGAVVGEHLGVGRERADEDEVAVDPGEQQRRVEVPVLHRRDPGAVVLQQRVAEAVRGHRDDRVGATGARHVRREGVGQRRLQPVEVVHRHTPRVHHGGPWGGCQRPHPPLTYPGPGGSTRPGADTIGR